MILEPSHSPSGHFSPASTGKLIDIKVMVITASTVQMVARLVCSKVRIWSAPKSRSTIAFYDGQDRDIPTIKGRWTQTAVMDLGRRIVRIGTMMAARLLELHRVLKPTGTG